MPEQSEIAIRHFESVLTLTRALQGVGISVVAHAFDLSADRSWELMAGAAQRFVRIAWDGLQGVLSAAVCRSAGANTGAWRDCEVRHFPAGDLPEVYNMAHELVRKYTRENV